MAEVAIYVVDASAALKWRFQDEDASQQALDLFTDYVSGRVNLIGPHQLPYEFASVIRDRVLERKLDRDDGARAIRSFLALRVPTLHPEGLVGVAYDVSFRYNLSLYDSLYVALAQMEHAPLVTGDRRLVHAVGTRFDLMVPLEEYGPHH